MSEEKEAPKSQRAKEDARRRRLLEDAKRPMAVNLAEGIALSEFLSTYTGSAETPEEQREAFHVAQNEAASGD